MTFLSAQWIGWLATGLTVSSYFCRDARVLRLVQGTAAFIWIGYGALIASSPIIVANILIAGVALWSTFRGPGRQATPT